GPGAPGVSARHRRQPVYRGTQTAFRPGLDGQPVGDHLYRQAGGRQDLVAYERVPAPQPAPVWGLATEGPRDPRGPGADDHVVGAPGRYPYDDYWLSAPRRPRRAADPGRLWPNGGAPLRRATARAR